MNLDLYIDDLHHFETCGTDKAMATHLRELARRLIKQAKRFEEECSIYDSLHGSTANTVGDFEDQALQQQVLQYIKQNYKKIGDISMAYGLINLVRLGSQYYRG